MIIPGKCSGCIAGYALSVKGDEKFKNAVRNVYDRFLQGLIKLQRYELSVKKLYPDLDAFAPVYLGLDKGADWKAEVTEMAELMVKRDMITHAIAEREGIETVTEEEYKAQVKYWVDYYYGYMTEAEVIQNMGETFLKESAFAEKMDKWLLEQVTFTYADGTPIVSNTNNEAESETSEG